MSFALLRALRYGRAWLRDPGGLVESEHPLPVEGGTVPATVLRPARARRPLPAWVVLHGVTRPGRRHPTLVRFSRALAATGAVVIIPDVPDWIALRLRPARAEPTVKAALDWLEGDPGVAPGRTGLAGFSFGAPQVILAASREGIAHRVSAVLAYGGYCDLPRTVRFQMTGWHEWEGTAGQMRPDAYGRWILAGNFLNRVPGWEGAGAVADALLELASAAGEARLPAWDPSYEPLKERLRGALDAEERTLFDLFAPPAEHDPPPDGPETRTWAERLAAAATREEPLLDAVRELGELAAPVHVLHGRSDSLIPSSEALRLGAHLAGHAPVRVTVTGRFGHSDEADATAGGGGLRERWAFVAALARVLGSV